MRSGDAQPDLGLKPRDAWWTVLVIDPIVLLLLPSVRRLRSITPMRITAVALLLGIASIASFAVGELVLGAVLYQLHFILDCLDGKLARSTGQASAWGAFVDLASDTIIVGATYAALGWWMFQEGIAGADAVLVLLPALAISGWLHLYRRLALGEEERVSGPAQAPTRVWSLRRLRPYPGSVEVETLVLLVFPVLLPLAAYPYVIVLATAFYLVSAADSWRRIRRRLR